MGIWDTENEFLCVVETSLFMKEFLPVNERFIEEILYRMKAQGYYSGGRWKDFLAADKEDAVLAAFLKVGNAIRKAAEEAMKAEDDSPDRLGANDWVYHKRLPRSEYEYKYNIDPDALLVLKEQKDWMEQVCGTTQFFRRNFLNIEYP